MIASLLRPGADHDGKTRPFRDVRPLRRADGEPGLGSVLFQLGSAQRCAPAMQLVEPRSLTVGIYGTVIPGILVGPGDNLDRHAPVALCGVGCRSRRAVRLGGARRLQDRSSASSEIDLTEIVAGERGEEHSAIQRCGEASLDVQEVARVKGVAAQDPQGRHRKRDPRRLHKLRPPARRSAPRWGQLALL